MSESTRETTHYQPSTFERWVLRTLIGLLVALVGWIGIRAIDGQDKTAAAVNDLTTRVAVMSGQLSDLTAQVQSTSELQKQVATMQQVQADHERRIGRLEDATTPKAREWPR